MFWHGIKQNAHDFFSRFKGLCGANQFQCQLGVCKHDRNADCDGPCIKQDWVNDGAIDCTDGSDEGEWYWHITYVHLKVLKKISPQEMSG